MNALTSKLLFGGRSYVTFLTNSAYTACCICTEAQEMRAPCMFDWHGTQTRATLLLLHWNAKPQILCVHCIIQISQLQFFIAISNLLSCENSLKSISDVTIHLNPFSVQGYYNVLFCQLLHSGSTLSFVNMSKLMESHSWQCEMFLKMDIYGSSC